MATAAKLGVSVFTKLVNPRCSIISAEVLFTFKSYSSIICATPLDNIKLPPFSYPDNGIKVNVIALDDLLSTTTVTCLTASFSIISLPLSLDVLAIPIVISSVIVEVVVYPIPYLIVPLF